MGLLEDVGDRFEVKGLGELVEQLVSIFAEAPALDDALPRVCEGVGAALGWDVVHLWLLDHQETALRRRCGWFGGAVDDATFGAASERTFRRGAGLPGRVLEVGAPVWVTDLTRDEEFGRREEAAAGLHCAFAFPVIAGSRTIGVVESFSRASRDPSAELVERLTTLGRELGWFIERRTAEEERLALLRAEHEARAEAEAARERLRFLAEASSVLAESLDLDTTLARVTSLAVPTLGDWCVIHLVEDGRVRLAAAAHTDERLVGLLREAHERYPTHLDAAGGIGAVIRTGEASLHPVVSDDVLAAVARDAEHLAMLRRLGFGSVLTIPLAARGRRIGALTVATDRGARLEPGVVETAHDLARRASVAIDNARLHQELRFQAALLQTQAEAGMEGQLIVDPNGRMISFNRRFAEMWRLPEDVLRRRSDEEALARAIAQVVDARAFLARVHDLYANPRPARDEIVLRDGRVFDRYGAPLTADGVTLGYAWYFRDVTEEKHAERRLLEAGERFGALARTLQQSLLPPQLPDVPGVVLAARYQPSGSGADVGGDFYDVFRIARATWGIAVGDVCGRGAEAATVTALARYTIRAAAMQARSPAKTLAALNDAMVRQGGDVQGELFATVAHARIQPRREGVHVVAASGGHPLPYVRRATGAVEVLGEPGTLLGMLPAVRINDARTILAPGDALVLVTDGVLEARRGRDQFGEDRLARLLQGTVGMSADEIARVVEEAALAHHDGEAADDIAVLVLTARAPKAGDGHA